MFLLLFKKKFMTNLEKYTDHNEKFYLKQPQCCLFYQVFCIITAINLFLKSTVEL